MFINPTANKYGNYLSGYTSNIDTLLLLLE